MSQPSTHPWTKKPARILRWLPSWIWPLGGVLMLLFSFYLLGQSTENSADFGRLYSWLFAINALGLVVLGILIIWNLLSLVHQYQRRAVGARLTTRLVIMFTVLSVAPVSVVFYYSVQFINRGIDTWFDVRIDEALNDAVTLSRSALDQRIKKNHEELQGAAEKIRDIPDRLANLAITDMRVLSNADELTLLGPNGHIISFSSKDPGRLIPDQPTEQILTQARSGEPYMDIEPLKDDRLGVRIVVSDVGLTEQNGSRLLQGLYYMPERTGQLADNVQSVAGSYSSIVYLREPLKDTFTFTLFMVSLLSLAFAVWTAFFFAKRLTKPIRDLAEGTRAVAQGDYHHQLPAPANDDIGLLVRSFNAMTRRLAEARDAELFSQQAIESQRAYLATVLGSLSSGVLTVDNQGIVRTMNTAGGQILELNPKECAGRKPSEIASRHEHLQGFIDAIAESIDNTEGLWEREITVFGPEGRRVLMCRGTLLPQTEQSAGESIEGKNGGNVIVFDDITALVQAQRDSAWGEVARRLAHEIKNPLTPIQLSAERLQHRLSRSVEGKDAEVLTRSTSTIIQQVESMKEMVNAFRDYAKPPLLAPEPLDINELIHQVMDLYRGTATEIEKFLQLDTGVAHVEVDKGRFRQVLHNLIKNAIEALHDTANASIFISTHCVNSRGTQYIEIQLSDNGPGFAEEVRGTVFEPYVTNKPKGTGLGLAIVKKIIEEHGGIIRAENRPQGGALISIRLPAAAGTQTGEQCRNDPESPETPS